VTSHRAELQEAKEKLEKITKDHVRLDTAQICGHSFVAERSFLLGDNLLEMFDLDGHAVGTLDT
jgi:oligoribonuclease (3'-5' exoribonuclease)